MKNNIIIIIVSILLLILIVSIFILEKVDYFNVNKSYENMTIDGDNYIVNDNSEIINITKKGNYYFKGDVKGIIINTSGDVKLNLEDVSIKTNDMPGILVKNASNVYIELKGENVIEANVKSDYDAAIYSKDDLIISGDGKLKLTSNIDGIISNDNLTINGGVYSIKTSDEAVKGKDSVMITSGVFEINADGDGIKTTNQKEKGNINISGGVFDINSKSDAINAINTLTITNGTFDIKTTSSSSESNKGLKAKILIDISGGAFNIDTYDDSIHSNNNINLSNLTLDIVSNDDGIHADKILTIESGTINIKKSYEGIEANTILINNGTININAKDDGINVAGGADKSSKNHFNTYGTSILTINNGVIYVNALGDGLDANGSIYINGGVINVDGPTSNGNGGLDYDNECLINGGEVIIVGSRGMAQNVSSKSSQNTILILLDKQESGNISFGNITYKPQKSYQAILISSNKLKINDTYSLKINGHNYDDVKLTKSILTYQNK